MTYKLANMEVGQETRTRLKNSGALLDGIGTISVDKFPSHSFGRTRNTVQVLHLSHTYANGQPEENHQESEKHTPFGSNRSASQPTWTNEIAAKQMPRKEVSDTRRSLCRYPDGAEIIDLSFCVGHGRFHKAVDVVRPTTRESPSDHWQAQPIFKAPALICLGEANQVFWPDSLKPHLFDFCR